MTKGSLIKATSDATFGEDVLNATGPVIVDFFAPWCGPCRLMTKVLDAIAQEYHGRVQVFQLNIDTDEETPFAYKVYAIPDVRIFKDGQEIAKVVGVTSKAQLRSALDAILT
jgi:thioredoxin 1